MALDAQAFFSLLGEPPVTVKRRTSLRLPAEKLATIRRLSVNEEATPLHVIVANLSDSGIGLLCPFRLPRGPFYSLTMREGTELRNRHVKIISSRKRSDGSFQIAARFV